MASAQDEVEYHRKKRALKEWKRLKAEAEATKDKGVIEKNRKLLSAKLKEAMATKEELEASIQAETAAIRYRERCEKFFLSAGPICNDLLKSTELLDAVRLSQRMLRVLSTPEHDHAIKSDEPSNKKRKVSKAASVDSSDSDSNLDWSLFDDDEPDNKKRKVSNAASVDGSDSDIELDPTLFDDDD